MADAVIALPSGPNKVAAAEGPLSSAPGAGGPTKDKGP